MITQPTETEQKLQALRINEARLKNKIAQLEPAPEHAANVARAKSHLIDLQTEIKKLAPKPATPAKPKK
jgi:septal ring factor EnvC (AmiA/AmiB activator)